MDFTHIKDTFLNTTLKITTSLIILVIPFAIIYRLFIWTVYSPPLWAYYGIFVKIFVLEHAYRLMAKATRNEEIGWVNSWIPQTLFRTTAIIMIGEVVQLFFPMALRVFYGVPQWLFFVIAFPYLFAVSLLVYALNFSMVAYAMDGKTKLLVGIRESFSVARHNLLFFVIVVVAHSLITLIPVVGTIFGMALLLFSEYIRCHLYAFVYPDKFEDRVSTDFEDYGQDYGS